MTTCSCYYNHLPYLTTPWRQGVAPKALTAVAPTHSVQSHVRSSLALKTLSSSYTGVIQAYLPVAAPSPAASEPLRLPGTPRSSLAGPLRSPAEQG